MNTLAHFSVTPGLSFRTLLSLPAVSIVASSLDSVEKEQRDALSEVSRGARPSESSMSPSFCVKNEIREKKVNVTLFVS